MLTAGLDPPPATTPRVPREASTATPSCSAPPIPEGPGPVCPRLALEFEPWRPAASWTALPQRARQREADWPRRRAEREAKLRRPEPQLFGRKTATTAATGLGGAPTPTAAARPRGQQPGRPGHARRDHSPRPAVVAQGELPADACCCQRGGRPFAPVRGTADSTLLEVEVQAPRRLIRRHRYRPTCDGGAHPGILPAPPAPRVIPTSILGVSIGVEVLLDKYRFDRPTSRRLAEWQTLGLDWSWGTRTDGLQRWVPLFEPVYEALAAYRQRQPLWHADETRWLVFATREGKVG